MTLPFPWYLGLVAAASCAPVTAHGTSTRAKLEASEDAFCRDITRIREAERDLGLLPLHGEAGAPSADSGK